ncbi:MAG TPA: hypothetical protein VET65_07270 [Candidatus Limnocylindrales bacterium]|nr:hypothetical protein [Candidatus Limnocylindrales bacterium]
MSLTRTLVRFAFLAAIAHQITYTLVEGSIFEDARQRVSGLHPKLAEFVRCHLCMGTWVGLLLAAAYQPHLLRDVQPQRPSLVRRALDLAADAFLLALGARIWNEGLGLLRREVQVKQTEIDRRAYPGISVR